MMRFASSHPLAVTIFFAVTTLYAAGCAAETAPAESQAVEAADADLTAAQSATLTSKVKAAYEDSVKNRRSFWLPGEKAFPSNKLRGDALTAFKQDAETSKGYSYGYPEVRSALVGGRTVYAISGIVSDTGDILGFYDSKGNELCEAYSGQGEHPNANGVDWSK
jgi:hypothetical protein